MKLIYKKLFSLRNTFADTSSRKYFSSFLLVCLFVLINKNAEATAAITTATGGSIITDKAANATSPLYTTLGNIKITEGTSTDMTIGTNVTLTLTAPVGWVFNTAAAVTATFTAARDITSASVLSKTTSVITIQFTVGTNTKHDALTVGGVQIQASDGANLPGNGNITSGGTAIILGCSAGTNLGAMVQTIGASSLVVSLPGQTFTDSTTLAGSGNSGAITNQISGTSFTIAKITACDQFYNQVTTYTGAKTIAWSGPSTAVSAPTYTTAVSFTTGQSTTTLTTTLSKAETRTITVTDGIVTGVSSSGLTVNPAVLNNFLVQNTSGASIASQIAGTSFNIMVTARDAENNTCNTGVNLFTGTTDITSSGTLSSGSGTTPAFVAGILSSRSVTISPGGTFTVTATKTGSSQTGTSNSFIVNNPVPSSTTISPGCISTGGGTFILAVNGSNFNASSVVRFNGSNRVTSFVNDTSITATIFSSDIAAPGIYNITVYNPVPGGGNTSSIQLLLNSTGSNNISICNGASYTPPGGSAQTTTGVYITHITNAAGCDSTITTNLTVIPNSSSSKSLSICNGASYTPPGGSAQTTTGVYITHISNTAGCDSTITTNLTVIPNSSSSRSLSICEGDTVILPDSRIATPTVSGDFISTVQNANGCDSTITTHITVNTVPILNASASQIDCFGNTGSVSLSASGGTTPYSYGPAPTVALSEGNYIYIVTDSNNCFATAEVIINHAPSQLTLTATANQIACFNGRGSVTLNTSGGTPTYSYTGSPATNLVAGNYNYTVRDSKGCLAVTSATINTAPTLLRGTVSTTPTQCNASTGTATLSPSGGTAPYSCLWNTSPSQTTPVAHNLSAGSHAVTITDSHGCIATATSINSSLTPPACIITGNLAYCPGGTTTLCATAGLASYAWNTGDTTQCITADTAGIYSVVVMNTSGCSNNKSATITESTFPICSISGGNYICPNGTVTLGAQTGYTSYLWSNGIRAPFTTVRAGGIYSVTIKNSAGCISTCSKTITPPLKIIGTKINGSCSNAFLGSILIAITGGTSPFTYLWSNGTTTQNATGLIAGNYYVWVTDFNGCSLKYTAAITTTKGIADYSTINSGFNDVNILAGSYLWFNSSVKVNYSGSYPVAVHFTDQKVSSSKFSLTVPNGTLILTNSATQTTTEFTGTEWVTTAPPNPQGIYFISGLSYLVRTTILRNLKPVSWKGIWTASCPGVDSVEWKFGTSVYSRMGSALNTLGVKPANGASSSLYNNNDSSGTPENYKSYCISGARGYGSTNYTGSFSIVGSRIPCSPSTCMNTGLVAHRYTSEEPVPAEEGGFQVSAFPNPFTSSTTIEFERTDKSSYTVVEVYNLSGSKVADLFDNTIEQGIKYSVIFHPENLEEGIYVYKIISSDKVVNGKLILMK